MTGKKNIQPPTIASIVVSHVSRTFNVLLLDPMSSMSAVETKLTRRWGVVPFNWTSNCWETQKPWLGGETSNIFYFHPYLGKIPILTNIFQMGWNHQLVEGWLNFKWFFDRLRSHGNRMDLAFFQFTRKKRERYCLELFPSRFCLKNLGKFGCHFSKSQKAGEVNIQLIGCVVPRRWHQCDPLFPAFKPRKWQQQFQTQSLTNPRNKKHQFV